MVRLTTMGSPFLLGFDEMERALERAVKTGSDGYPPYNIERLPAASGQPDRIRITLAVAGGGPPGRDGGAGGGASPART
jgi:HSP20 family molecular chaperone IbpA